MVGGLVGNEMVMLLTLTTSGMMVLIYGIDALLLLIPSHMLCKVRPQPSPTCTQQYTMMIPNQKLCFKTGRRDASLIE